MYTAPEVLIGNQSYDPKLSDTWSCGIVLFILLSAGLPFSKNDLREIIKAKNVSLMKLPSHYNKSLSVHPDLLLRRILVFTPSARQTLGDIITDEIWFKTVLPPAVS